MSQINIALLGLGFEAMQIPQFVRQRLTFTGAAACVERLICHITPLPVSHVFLLRPIGLWYDLANEPTEVPAIRLELDLIAHLNVVRTAGDDVVSGVRTEQQDPVAL